MMKKIGFLLLVLIAFQASETFAQNSAWVDFADESSRLKFDINDNQEKDMIVGDVDNDGDEDIVIVRKRPFSVDGPRQNVLLINENGTLFDRTDEFIPTFISDPDNARDVVLFDANNNGWQDMIIANTFGSLPRLYINLGADGCESEDECCMANDLNADAKCWDGRCCNKTGKGCTKDK